MDHHTQNQHHHPSPNVDNDPNVPSFPASRAFHGENVPTEHAMDLNIPLIATVAAVSSLLVIVIVLSVQAWFTYEQGLQRELKANRVTNQELRDLQQQQQAGIDSYRWVDNNQKTVAVPIGRAMELTVEHYSQRPGLKEAQQQHNEAGATPAH